MTINVIKKTVCVVDRQKINDYKRHQNTVSLQLIEESQQAKTMNCIASLCACLYSHREKLLESLGCLLYILQQYCWDYWNYDPITTLLFFSFLFHKKIQRKIICSFIISYSILQSVTICSKKNIVDETNVFKFRWLSSIYIQI